MEPTTPDGVAHWPGRVIDSASRPVDGDRVGKVAKCFRPLSALKTCAVSDPRRRCRHDIAGFSRISRAVLTTELQLGRGTAINDDWASAFGDDLFLVLSHGGLRSYYLRISESTFQEQVTGNNRAVSAS